MRLHGKQRHYYLNEMKESVYTVALILGLDIEAICNWKMSQLFDFLESKAFQEYQENQKKQLESQAQMVKSIIVTLSSGFKAVTKTIGLLVRR